MKNEFTPGPWEILGDSTLHINSKATIKGRKICSMLPNTDAETRANATLIAATPELYEALAGLSEAIKTCPEFTDAMLNIGFDIDVIEWLKTARSALTKARGES